MSDTHTPSNTRENPSQPTRVGFLMLRNYTMISLATAVEPLRMANELAGRELYEWLLITGDGKPVSASDGILNIPDNAIENVSDLDALIVVGGTDIQHSYTEHELDWLRQLDARGVQLGGICTGAYVLAAAGLLDGYECSVHWECMNSLQELYPKVSCNNQLFTVERRRLTSTGGTAPLDMMLNIICRAHGLSLARGISEMFVLDRIRNQDDSQKIPLRHTMGITSPKLVEATALMDANVEEPIPLEELASFLSISRRQLERLFKSNLDCSPSRYYLRLRLYRARQLLRQTSLSIIEVASLCGFVSTPHFSKCYRTHLGNTPREERSGPSTGTDPIGGDELNHSSRNPANIEPHFGSIQTV